MTVNQSTPNRIPAAHPLLGQVGAAAGHYDELRALPGAAGAGVSAGQLARAWQSFLMPWETRARPTWIKDSMHLSA